MNHKQYSDIQRCIGILEGVGYALEDRAGLLFYDTLEALSSIIEELAPEIGDEEGCPEEECSPTKGEPDGLQLYTKYDFNTDRPVAYAYGEPWVEWALRQGSMAYPTPEEAKAAWKKGQSVTVTVEAGNGTAIGNGTTRYDPDIPETPTLFKGVLDSSTLHCIGDEEDDHAET